MAWNPRAYSIVLNVLTTADEIAACEAAIPATQVQTADPFPKPSGQFRPLKGRG